MNNDDRIEPCSSAHELEDVLRTLKPRTPRFDVEAICEASSDRGPWPLPPTVSSRLSWWAIGGASAASALIGAAVVFTLLRVQIRDLQKEIASLSLQQANVAVIAQERNVPAATSDNGNVELPAPDFGADAKRFVSKLPLLPIDESNRGRLIVGSHLNRITYRLSVDNATSRKVNSSDQGIDAFDATSDQPRPVTRATLMEDLLDT